MSKPNAKKCIKYELQNGSYNNSEEMKKETLNEHRIQSLVLMENIDFSWHVSYGGRRGKYANDKVKKGTERKYITKTYVCCVCMRYAVMYVHT